MFDFSVVADNIKDLYREKKVLFIVISILVVLFFLGLIAVVVQSCSHEPEVPVYKEEVLYPDQKLLLPEGPSIPDGYAVTREPQDKWSKEEAEEFFTLPGTTELKALESANNKLVDDILGAAP